MKKKKKQTPSHGKKTPPVIENTGIIFITPGGYGFVKTPDNGEIFIPPQYINGAIHEDEVKIELFRDRRNRRGSFTDSPIGKVIKIQKRNRTEIVGELIAGNKIRPLNKHIIDDIPVSGTLKNVKKGDWVKAKLCEKNGNLKVLTAEIKQKIGKAYTVEGDIAAIIKEFNLPKPYSPKEDKEAGLLTPIDIERQDLTNLFCITVDPTDAKDFDDAVSIIDKNDDEVILGVHIADVAVWIQPDSKWDKKAKKRGFTAYLPGKTLHMLPESLTKIISLTPDRPSLAHTILITINRKNGEIISSERMHSIIKVKERLSFDDVSNFIHGKINPSWSDELKYNLNLLFETYKTMRVNRKAKEVFLDLATTEIRVVCDDVTGDVIGLKKEEQGEAEKMIEDFMLAANTEVAKELKLKSVPAVYRVHPDPLPEKVEEFTDFILNTFGFYPGDITSRTACNNFLASLKDDHTKPIILNAFLRSLPRAFYQYTPDTHYGLGKSVYCHFTSPIRRYTDLIVHQQLLITDTKKGKLQTKAAMQKNAARCSEQEVNIVEAWFAANDRLKLHYLKKMLKDADAPFYEAVIIKTSASGLSIDVPELGVYGIINREALSGNFMYRKKQSKLVAVKGHQEYKTGDFIYVQLAGIDFIKGKALFAPVR